MQHFCSALDLKTEVLGKISLDRVLHEERRGFPPSLLNEYSYRAQRIIFYLSNRSLREALTQIFLPLFPLRTEGLKFKRWYSSHVFYSRQYIPPPPPYFPLSRSLLITCLSFSFCSSLLITCLSCWLPRPSQSCMYVSYLFQGVTCLGRCKGEQECATRCFAQYGSNKLDSWLTCTLEVLL